MSYIANTILPNIESRLDGIASDLIEDEVKRDEASYNIGRYNGALEMTVFILRELSSHGIRIDIRNGEHFITV